MEKGRMKVVQKQLVKRPRQVSLSPQQFRDLVAGKEVHLGFEVDGCPVVVRFQSMGYGEMIETLYHNLSRKALLSKVTA